MKPCPFLNDRVVEGDAINAKCEAPMKEACPKLRSTKKAVTRQCWRIAFLKPEEIAAKQEKIKKPRGKKKPKESIVPEPIKKEPVPEPVKQVSATVVGAEPAKEFVPTSTQVL